MIVVIPARLDSKRFPRKVLHIIDGEPMVVSVAKRAINAGIGEVYITTADKEIKDIAIAHNINTIDTGEHKTGSDRVDEAVKNIKFLGEYVINLQGDQPFFEPIILCELKKAILNSKADIITPVFKIEDKRELEDENVVKVAVSEGNRALYFSRSRVPSGGDTHYHHVGIYCYKRSALEKFASLKRGVLEKQENLEQLRAIENDMYIETVLVGNQSPSVDSVDNLLAPK